MKLKPGLCHPKKEQIEHNFQLVWPAQRHDSQLMGNIARYNTGYQTIIKYT